jgi:hypothetical protein
MISNNRLSARIDAIASSFLRAHRLVTDERLALSPEASVARSMGRKLLTAQTRRAARRCGGARAFA